MSERALRRAREGFPIFVPKPLLRQNDSADLPVCPTLLSSPALRLVSSLPPRRRVGLVLTGGQTGVDRAALDAALAAGVAAGGWCPAGRWAEDGPIAACYPLRETESADPAVRTRRNVDDADALLVLSPTVPTGGTALALDHARALGRPALVVDPWAADAFDQVSRWLQAFAAPPVLNVAGPRESECPGICAVARGVLSRVFR